MIIRQLLFVLTFECSGEDSNFRINKNNDHSISAIKYWAKYSMFRIERKVNQRPLRIN